MLMFSSMLTAQEKGTIVYIRHAVYFQSAEKETIFHILCTGGEYYAPSNEGSISYLFCVQGGKVMCGR